MSSDIEKDLMAVLDDTQLDVSLDDDIEKDILAAAGEEDPKPAGEEDPKPAGEEDPKPAGEEDPKPAGEEDPKPAGDDTAAVKTDKAPASWSPENREHWAGLPDGLKQQIATRERQINDTLQTTTNDRKLSQAFNEVVTPFKAMMAAEGAQNPLQAVHGLLNTAAILKSGSKEQRASKIVDLIGHYDVDIGVIDKLLMGQEVKPEANSEVEKIVAERLKPLETMINRYQQQEQGAVQTKNDATIREAEAFKNDPKNEFFQDVRMTMADVMDLARSQGRVVTMQEAYDTACTLTPSVKTVLDGRAASLAAKKKAATSLNHRNAPQGTAELPDDLESAIGALWDGEQA